MKKTKMFRSIVLLFVILTAIVGCNNNQQVSTFSKADSTAVLQAVFDFQNADFDTVASLSKRLTNDTMAIFLNKAVTNRYDLKYKSKPIYYTSIDPLTAETTISKPQMVLYFWNFKKQQGGDTVKVSFGIRDWGLICDYRLVKDSNKWRVIGLKSGEGKM